MLTRLLKWEIKATARLLIPLYITLILFAFINRLVSPFSSVGDSSSVTFHWIISTVTTIAYGALIVGIVVMTLIIMIQRFYKSLLGDEGYLMFTLPTETWKHVLSKLLVAMMWTLASIIVTFMSVMIISGARFPVNFFEVFNELTGIFGALSFYMIPIIALVSVAVNILMIYTAISLGHLFPRNKLIASFAMYALVYMVNQVVTGITFLGVGHIFFRDIMNEATPRMFNLPLFLLVLSGFFLICAAVYFTVTTVFLKKKLNLE